MTRLRAADIAAGYENKKIILTNLVFANSIYKYVGKSKAPEH